MKNPPFRFTVFLLVVFLGLVALHIRSRLWKDGEPKYSEDGESSQSQDLFSSRSASTIHKNVAATKSRSNSASEESRVRSRLALGDSEVGVMKVSRGFLETFQKDGKNEVGVYSLGKEELVTALATPEHIALVADLSYLEKSDGSALENFAQFEHTVRSEMPPEMEGKSWETVVGDGRIPGFSIEGKATLLASNDREIRLQYRHTEVVEWLHFSTGERFPRVSETTRNWVMKVPKDEVLVIPANGESSEGWVLFFGDAG